MLKNFDPVDLILYFVVFLFSLSLHEMAHAWTSEKFGDNTGRYLGRITLNPISHIDPLGTIVFPLVGYFMGGFMFGWAKPVPVNPLSWRNKKMANILTSLAGPASNFLLAILAIIGLKIILVSVANSTAEPGTLMKFSYALLTMFLKLNLILGVFNLIPIPPLDGSHVLEELLPPEAASAYDQIRPYGFFVLIALMYMGVFNYIIDPVFTLANYILKPS